jgi:hypothetical protein
VHHGNGWQLGHRIVARKNSSWSDRQKGEMHMLSKRENTIEEHYFMKNAISEILQIVCRCIFTVSQETANPPKIAVVFEFYGYLRCLKQEHCKTEKKETKPHEIKLQPLNN